jgi:prepilin-type N-terminal cleavage/methylation domain-containing protein
MKAFLRPNGFTLIELLVVISVLVMMMLAASALFLSAVVGNTKTARVQSVKNEGKYALAQMEFLLRNAVQLLPNSAGQTCEAGMTEVFLRSFDNKTTRLYKQTDSTDSKDKIASNSGIYLTSGGVDITEGPTFDCAASDDGLTQYLTISFTLRKGSVSLDATKDIVEETFQTGVNVRSF